MLRNRSRDVSKLLAVVLQVGKPPTRGEVLEICFEGATLVLGADGRPGLGTRLRVCFKVGPESRPVLLVAEVVKSRLVDGASRLGLRFLDTSRMRRVLSPEDWIWFNRRETYRVSCGAEPAVPVRLGLQGGPLDGRLLDLSTTGMAAAIPADARTAACRHSLVTARLELPAAPAPTVVVAAVVALDGTGGPAGEQRWGLRFDTRRTPDWRRAEEALTGYLMDRQRRLLEERSWLHWDRLRRAG